MITGYRPGHLPGGRIGPAAGAVAAGVAGGALISLSIDPIMALAAAVGIGGAVAVVMSADWALAAIAVFAVLRLAEVATEFHGAPSLFQPVTAAIVIGIIVRWVASGERPTGGGRALLLTGAYVLVAASTLFVAADVAGGTLALESLAKDVALAILIGILLHRGRSLRRMVWVLIGGGALMAGLSIVQVATGSFDADFFGFAQASVENIVGTTDDVRISGPIGDANFYAQILVMLLPLALDRMWRDPRRLGRITAGITAAMLTATIVMTFSRGGALGLVAVGILMLLTHPPRITTVLAMILIALVAIPLIPDTYVDRLSTVTQIGTVEGDTDISIRYRTAELTAGVGMVTDHPLTGVGYANYPDNYPEYSRGLGLDFRNTERKPHNLVVEVAAETGIPGLVAFGALLVGAFGALAGSRRRLLEAGHADTAALALAVGVGLVGHLVTSLFLHLDFARLFWTFIGIALALPNIADRECATSGSVS